jgi:hypothetical protein
MRWLRGLAILVVGLSAAQFGCGSDSFGGTGQGTLQLVRFGSGADEQPDSVGNTSAQADVCLNFCGATNILEEATLEPFSSTQVAAFLVNRGKSDITIRSIQASFPNSGLPDLNTAVAGGFAVPGGRCVDNPSVSCAADFECNGSFCVTQETPINFTILDLERKQLLAGDECNTGLVPRSIPSFVTIAGIDAEGENFTISGGMNIEVANFDNCDDN